MTNANDFAYPMTDITSCATAKGLTKREYIATSILSSLAALPSNTPSIERTIKADVELALKYTDALINSLNNQP